MAWEALARGAWEEAHSLFRKALSTRELPESVEGLSWAMWWLNDAEAVFRERERAYRLYRERGDLRGAARMATWLGTDHVDFRGELAVCHGWMARARRHLEGVEEGPEHGWLWVHEAEKFLLTNDAARAKELGVAAAELGRRLGVVDLEMMALATQGLSLVCEGATEEGMALLDEAAAASLGGEFREIFSTGWYCCYMIYACEQVRDYDRAAQWCKKLEEWSERLSVQFLNRSCRAHYAGVLIWRGVWARAEVELKESARRLAEIRPPMAAEASVRLAELRRRQGRLDEATAIFDEVDEHPLALLGLAEIALDRADHLSARDRAEQYLRAVTSDLRTLRAPGLELLVRALVALGRLEEAVAAADELGSVAEVIATDPLRASARLTGGLVAELAGDYERAREAFEDAGRYFQRSGAPFEAARARIDLSRVLTRSGRSGDAAREARSAAESLRRIGAALEVRRAEDLLQTLERPTRSATQLLTKREREVLLLVAEGKRDKVIASQLVLSEHTVHRHVSNILVKLGCGSRSAAVAEALRKELI